jgi:hypothetical protein
MAENGAVALTSEMEKMRQPFCNSDHSVLLFLLYRGEKEAKRGTLWKSWGFRPLPGFICDETKSALGRCPKNPRPFEKGRSKLLDCFATAPS